MANQYSPNAMRNMINQNKKAKNISDGELSFGGNLFTHSIIPPLQYLYLKLKDLSNDNLF